jgi:hypothetical protein
MKLLAVAGAAATAALAGCGGSSGGDSSGGGTTAASPRAAFKCLTDAGLNVKSTPPGRSTIVSAMQITEGGGGDDVWFTKSPAAAKDFTKVAKDFINRAGVHGQIRILAGTIVLGETPGKSPDPAVIEGCLTD